MTIKKYSLSDPDITKSNIGNPNADALDECIIQKIQGIIPSVVLAIPVGFLIALIFDFAGFKIAAILGVWNFYLSSFFVSNPLRPRAFGGKGAEGLKKEITSSNPLRPRTFGRKGAEGLKKEITSNRTPSDPGPSAGREPRG
jgi:hypothetical protein